VTLRFGTDGVRGPADELSDHLVTALGRAAATILGGDEFVVGRDPRQSGPRLERALVRGLTHGGSAVERLGVVPTPLVARICADRGVAGAMISASHNAYHDNGIKFFVPGGLKLTDAVEADLEAELDRLLAATSETSPPVEERVLEDESRTVSAALVADDVDRYREAVVASIEGRDVRGLRVVIDCANGAASEIAPRLLRDLGCELEVLHASPDGRNINAGSGSTYPAALQAAVVASGADVGLAFDGDADRVLAVDELGELIDGDHLIALCALDMRARGLLVDDTVVVTVMTNLGFRLAMATHGIQVIETQVGDRYVLEALESGGLSLGGEQSGHVIFRRLATTGDGLLTGVQLLDLLARAGQPLSALAAASMTRLPQVLISVPVAVRSDQLLDDLADEIAAVESELGDQGRVLVRPSGTEPLVRVMVEAADEGRARSAAERLVDAVGRAAPPA